MAEGQRRAVVDAVPSVLTSARLSAQGVAVGARELMEAEITEQIGAERGEVSPERTTPPKRLPPACVGDPGRRDRPARAQKDQGAAYFPSFLEPRRRSEQAIIAVVLEAYTHGVSTGKVDRLVEQLGVQGMGKDRVSALCRGLDAQVAAFRSRPLEGEYPYLFLDAVVRHEALSDRAGGKTPPPRAVAGSPAELRAA